MFRHTHIFLRCVSVRGEWTKDWDDLYMRWHEEQGTLNGKALSKHREGSMQVKILKLGLFSVEVWLCVCLSNCVQHWRDFCQISLPTLLSCLMLQPWEGALNFLILQLWYCHRQIAHQVGYSCWNPLSPYVRMHVGEGRRPWVEWQHPFWEPHRWPFLAEVVWQSTSKKVQSCWHIMTGYLLGSAPSRGASTCLEAARVKQRLSKTLGQGDY